MTIDEFEQMQVDAFNNEIGELKGIDCQICKNKGYIMYLEKGYKNLIPCKCLRKRKLIRRAEESGLGDYVYKTINDFLTAEKWQYGIKAKAIDFMADKSDKWFMACGQSGCGKTLICSIIANDFLSRQNKRVIYITWTDFISRLKRDMMGDNTNEVTKYLYELKNVEILFLDEVLKKYNETDLKYLIEIINYRYTNNLKTLITSERVIGELLDIDEATFGRVVEKCEKYLINIPKDRAKNYRLRGI